jgi:uncharacterized integral membrane protein (TIGR00698 family)
LAPAVGAAPPGPTGVEHHAELLALYRRLGGLLEAPVLRPGAWDLTFEGGLVVELDEGMGVALLGLRISAGDLVSLGATGLGLAVTTVAATFVFTIWLGRRLGLASQLALLIGAGSAICGAFAVAATANALDADEEQAGYAVATVTVFGTLAMVLVPVVGPQLLGLSAHQTALWAGAAIHEVAQVAGAAAGLGGAALATATLVKLARVVLLAPSVALVAGRGATGAQKVPGFILAFCALVAARSMLPLPAELLDAVGVVTSVLLAAGLAGLGLGVSPAALRAAGARPLALGLAASLAAGGTSLLGVLMTT